MKLKKQSKTISEIITEEEKKNKTKDYDKRRKTKRTQS